jgi:hypothetical protein
MAAAAATTGSAGTRSAVADGRVASASTVGAGALAAAAVAAMHRGAVVVAIRAASAATGGQCNGGNEGYREEIRSHDEHPWKRWAR